MPVSGATMLCGSFSTIERSTEKVYDSYTKFRHKVVVHESGDRRPVGVEIIIKSKRCVVMVRVHLVHLESSGVMT